MLASGGKKVYLYFFYPRATLYRDHYCGSFYSHVLPELLGDCKVYDKLRFPPSDTSVPSQPAPTTSISQQPVAEQSDQATRQFIDFLKTLQKPGRDIFKQCHSFCHSVAYKKVSTLYLILYLISKSSLLKV